MPILAKLERRYIPIPLGEKGYVGSLMGVGRHGQLVEMHRLAKNLEFRGVLHSIGQHGYGNVIAGCPLVCQVDNVAWLKNTWPDRGCPVYAWDGFTVSFMKPSEI